MTNGERIRSMTDEQLAEFLEDFAEAYISFWIMPFDQCDFSHREQDKKLQLSMLKSEYIGDKMYEF